MIEGNPRVLMRDVAMMEAIRALSTLDEFIYADQRKHLVNTQKATHQSLMHFSYQYVELIIEMNIEIMWKV